MKASRRTTARIAAGLSGAAVCALALLPSVDRLADRSFADHMAQHMLLVYVAPPLLLFARPTATVLAAVGQQAGRRLTALFRAPLVSAITSPVAAWLTFAAVMWGTHFSGVYESALEHPAVHVFEHIALFAAGLLFWNPIVAPPPSPAAMNYPARMAYVFAAIPQGAFLGLALYQTRYVLYARYALASGSRAAALVDQQAGGALMWLAGGCILFLAFMLLGVAWSIEERRLARFDCRRRTGANPIVLAVLAVAALVLLPQRSTASEAVSSMGGVDGRLLFAQHCASCHGARLEGTSLGPSLGGVPAAAVDFYVGTGRMPKQEPHDQSGRSPVRFTPSQIAALVRYVTAVSHGFPGLPSIRRGTDVAAGKRAFIENCAACHGAAGSGDSVGYGWVAPSLRDATPRQIAEAVRIGPGIMPRFSVATLPDSQLADIVLYLETFRSGPIATGGLDLGYEGPVAEGAAAWIVGLGLIVIFVRRVGTDA